MAKRPVHHESKLQIQCVSWLKYQYPHLAPLFFAVPNGGSRNAREVGIMKAEGVTAGVSDLILNVPSGRYTQLDIEMKDGSSQSREQKRYQRYAEAVGIKYVICKSYEHFQGVVLNYLDNVNPAILESLEAMHREDKKAEVEEARRQYRKRCNTQSEQQPLM